MRKILLYALLIVTTFTLFMFFEQINVLGKIENIDIKKVIQNFADNHSYVVEALKNNKTSDDERTIIPQSKEELKDEMVYKEKLVNQDEEKIFDESTCKQLVLEYLKKSLYASEINSYQSIGRGKIANRDYFAFHFYKNNMYLISYYVDKNFNIFYRDIFLDKLRQAGTENLYRNISLNFDSAPKSKEQDIINFINETLHNENNKYEIIYGGYYNVNDRKMVYIYYYNDDDKIIELYYDCNSKELYCMTEILQSMSEY